jgi:hypothetical protein
VVIRRDHDTARGYILPQWFGDEPDWAQFAADYDAAFLYFFVDADHQHEQRIGVFFELESFEIKIDTRGVKWSSPPTQRVQTHRTILRERQNSAIVNGVTLYESEWERVN